MPEFLAPVMGMADFVSRLDTFTADLTFSSHSSSLKVELESKYTNNFYPLTQDYF